MNKIITIVGSRETPTNYLQEIQSLAKLARDRNWIIRSGKAPGADTYAQLGGQSSSNPTPMEIYIPWKGFGSDIHYNPLASELSDNYDILVNNPDITSKAFVIARGIHDNFDSLSQGSKGLHIRNVYQVFGKELNTPSNLVLCYAKVIGNNPQGRTATAIKLAKLFNIPVINMFFNNWKTQLHNTLTHLNKEN